MKEIRFFYLVLSYLIFNPLSYAASIKGVVFDKETNEPLIGVVVFVKASNLNSTTGLDGSYNIKNVNPGNYILTVQYIGYETQEQSLTIVTNDQKLKLDIYLNKISYQLGTVEVKGELDKDSDISARKSEKNADNILNVISANTIKLLPDLTTAGVLQRVSGVSLERTSTGDARYAIIRGMDQRYNYTLVNGIKIPSPDNKYRFIPMDMFPSDLLERLEVIKALTPSMEADAIGGAMNLIMKNAPNEFSFNANIGTGFNQLLSDRGYTNFDKSVISYKSPIDLHGEGYVATPNDFTYKNFDYHTQKLPFNSLMSFSLGNRFLKSKQLGIMVAGSYQNLYRGSNSIWFKPENQPRPGNIPSFDDIFIRQYNTQQTRYGIQSKIDYNINPDQKISLFNVFMELDEVQFRHTIDTSLSIGRSGTGTGNTYILNRSRIQDQSIFNTTLQGDHKIFNNLHLHWSGVYSIANSKTPDWSEFQTVQVVGYDANGNHTATPQVLNIPFYRIWTRNSDRDYAANLNLDYKTSIFKQEILVSIGGLYRDKFRDNHYNEWDLIPKTSSSGQPIVFDGVLSPDKFQFNGTSAAQGNQVNPLTYTASEKILAYYIQLKLLVKSKFEIITGARIENTEQGWQTVQDPKIAYGAIGKVPYEDVLPSLNIKYILSKNQNLRFSYFSAINRPGFFEYIPFSVKDDNFSISGNPKLKHASSNNIDLRFEYFPKALDQILIGAFYKRISNPIETAVLFTGTSSATLQPSNFGTATNYGFELTLAKFIGKFGISANYTYTNSSITTAKLFYNVNFVAEPTTQTRPLQGQSPHIANVSLLYKNPLIGLDLQIACVYTGQRITFVSPYKDLDYWQRETMQLDFSAEKLIFNHFTIYCKVNNILNTPVLVEILQPNIYKTGKFALTDQTNANRITVQKDYYGQNFIVGIRYKI